MSIIIIIIIVIITSSSSSSIISSSSIRLALEGTKGTLGKGTAQKTGVRHISLCVKPRCAQSSNAVDFRNFIVFFGPRPWHIEIRHRVKTNPQLFCSDLRLSN